MNDTVYHKLRECIDMYSIGFNETCSQVEIDLIKKIFTQEEAIMYMNLEEALKPVEKIAKKAGMNLEETEFLLNGMLKKGVVFVKKKNGKKYYAAVPFLQGFFEHIMILKSNDPSELKEMAELFGRYMSKGFMPTGRTMRTIPLNVSIETNSKMPVSSYDDAKKIIESKDRIGLFPCACASMGSATGVDCPPMREVCMVFDFQAEYGIEELGVGRWITREKALKILEHAREEGLVHQTGGDKRNVEVLCNCCADYCALLSKIKMFPEPSLLVVSNYLVHLDFDKCVACESCVDRCPMGAISAGEETVTVNLKRCIGCGVCTVTCPKESLTMQIKPEDQRHGPFDPETYTFIRSSLDYEADISE